MALSEQEQRALDELEAQLSAEDPKFASAMLADPGRRRQRGRALLGMGMATLGLAVVITAVWTRQIWFAAIGFGLMVFGVSHAMARPRATTNELFLVTSPDDGRRVHATMPRGATHLRPEPEQAPARPARSPRAERQHHGTFMARMEERWERRRRESQGW